MISKPRLKPNHYFFLFILSLLSNCQKEDDLVSEDSYTETKNNYIHAKRVSLEDIEQKAGLRQVLAKVEGNFDFNRAALQPKDGSRSKTSSKDGSFTILTDEILEVSTNASVAYTFRIEEPTRPSSAFENFVVQGKGNGDYRLFIYRYEENGAVNDSEFGYTMSREPIGSDKVDLGGLGLRMMYDPGSDCHFDVAQVGNDLVITLISCGDKGTTGDFNGTGGGGYVFGGTVPEGVSYTYGAWAVTGVYNSGDCAYARPLLNMDDSPLYSVEGQVLDQRKAGPCPGDVGYYDSDDYEGSDPYGDPWEGNHTAGPEDSYEPLGEPGGGGTGTTTEGGTAADSDEAPVGVLKDAFIMALEEFYLGLAVEQEAFLNANRTLKEEIERYLRYGAPRSEEDGAPLIAAEAKEFAELVIEALINYEFSTLAQDYRPRMSASEIAIFDGMGVVNQFIYLSNGQNATTRTEELFPNWRDRYNGKGDAFRHAIFNAQNVIGLGISLAESLATAHEDRPPSYPYNYKENQMDLFNNEVGRSKANFLSDGFSSLEESILDALNNGELRYLNYLDPNDNSATSSSVLIPSDQ